MQKNLQDTIQTLLNTLVAEGKERGTQVAAYIDGEQVIDAWAGVADVRTGRPVDGDTLFPVFSTTKGIFSTVIHILAERGKLDYDTPIATYWPEFAANGKEVVTMRHALSHTSGIPYMPPGITVEQTCDWDYMCAAVAQLKPSWPPGVKQVYHAITFGWIVGEVARRADGRSVPQLLADELCRPLGITRLFCGIPAELEPQTAFLEQVPNPPVTPPTSPNEYAPCMVPLHEWINRPEVRRTPQPGCSGIMSARSVARHYAALLPGGVDGVELLPPSRVKIATVEQAPTGGYDEGTGRKGLGYILGDGVSPTGFGHGGYGGSAAFADPRYRLAVSVVRNRFSDHDLASLVLKEIKDALGIS
jgi:CubicO group peptidase (beta-lactamase class C family)